MPRRRPPGARLVDDLAGDGQAFGGAVFAGAPHALELGFGEGDAGDLVLQVLGVVEVAQGHDAEEDGQALRHLRGVHQGLEGGDVEGRGRDQEVDAGLDLAPGVLDLALDVLGRGIDARADDERGRLGEGDAVAVVALVEAAQELDQLDGIDVPEAAGVGVVAQEGRRAGAGDDVPDAEGVGAEEVGLERHDALLPGRDGEDGFEVGHALLHEDGEAGGADLGARAAGLADEHGAGSRRP